jgi:catechol-2,3-dioxygenase
VPKELLQEWRKKSSAAGASPRLAENKMIRVHVHLKAADLNASRKFYEAFFGVPPVKLKPIKSSSCRPWRH